MLHETVKVVFRNTLMYIIKLSKSWYNVDRQPYHDCCARYLTLKVFE